MILGGSAHHRRASDVDLLDAGIEIRTRGNGLREGVQVHDNKLEGSHVELLQLCQVISFAGVGENTCVDAGVQRLHAAFQALGEAGDVLHRGDADACLGDGFRGRAGRDDLHVIVSQRGG